MKDYRYKFATITHLDGEEHTTISKKSRHEEKLSQIFRISAEATQKSIRKREYALAGLLSNPVPIRTIDE